MKRLQYLTVGGKADDLGIRVARFF